MQTFCSNICDDNNIWLIRILHGSQDCQQRRHLGGWRPSPPPQGERKKEKKRKKKKKEKEKRKKREKKEGNYDYMNSVQLLHIKCCFFQFFNSRWHWKIKIICPPKKKLKWRPWLSECGLWLAARSTLFWPALCIILLHDGCSLELCSATSSVASSGICHRNIVNSIAWLYRDDLP